VSTVTDTVDTRPIVAIFVVQVVNITDTNQSTVISHLQTQSFLPGNTIT
jgi:hypothetical protein